MERKSKIKFVIQKTGAFCIIYAISAVLMEGMILLLLSGLGYDALHGKMPTEAWAGFLPLYGYAGFGLITLLYVKCVEKRKLSKILFQIDKKSLLHFLKHFLLGSFLVAGIIGILLMAGGYRFEGKGEVAVSFLILALFAYMIQGTVEEVMCRGFLQNTLQEKIGMAGAVGISSIMFILPHIPTIVTMEGGLAVCAVINLFLVSVLFSLVMVKSNSVLAAGGMHVGWNFVLNVVFGLTVSGKEAVQGMILISDQSKMEWLTGGSYGIEASVLLIPVLGILDILFGYCI